LNSGPIIGIIGAAPTEEIPMTDEFEFAQASFAAKYGRPAATK
jgi:hypothetical protein